MKPICLWLTQGSASDAIFNLYSLQNKPITVLSPNPELFKDNPYVEKSFKTSSTDVAYFAQHYKMFQDTGVSDTRKKLLIITPHLSTGGAPQVTVNKIELIKDEFNIKVVEYEFAAWNYVVQRNRIMQLVGNENLVSLGKNKAAGLAEMIQFFQPDVISLEELPEMFMDSESVEVIYNNNRKYTVLETTHDSSFNTKHKRFFPDKFIFVSPYSAFKYAHLDVPTEIIEYPIDQRTRDKHAMQTKLELDSSYKHVVIVGLFTPRKNQAYAFELARRAKDKKVLFHFLGNYADNFKHYWEPLMKDKPDNCILWGERDDVKDFLEAADMFLFCSKGDRNNKELNPIAIKEAMEYKDVVKLMYNLDVYCGKYSGFENVHYLTGDIESDTNTLFKSLGLKDDNEEMVVITTYPNTTKRKQLTKECIESFKQLGRKIILVSHYPVSLEIQQLVDYYIYDSNNVMIHHSYYNRFYRSTNEFDLQININNHKQSNQSLAAMINLFNGIKFAKGLGASKVMTVVYDVVLNEQDIPLIEDYFKKIDQGWKCCLSYLDTDLGLGVETTAMVFDINYFLKMFPDVRDGHEFTVMCENMGRHNFLEHYFMGVLKDEVGLWIVNNDQKTIIPNSGLGVSSNSEYYSLVPVDGDRQKWVFYFYTYNLDERSLEIVVKEEDTLIFSEKVVILDNREYILPVSYYGRPMTISVVFYDGDNLYKTETYTLSEETIDKHFNNGIFKHL